MKNTTVILQSVATTVLSPVHTSNMSKQHVEFDMSKQPVERCFDMLPVAIRHVASTCCWCGRGFRHSTCRMLQVACCFDMLPVAVRHVAGVDGALQRCCFHQFA